MKLWYAIPTCNTPLANKTLELWRKRGFLTAALVDGDTRLPDADFTVRVDTYEGYYRSVNTLVREIAKVEGEMPDIIVTGGDDMYPDPKADPQRVAAECYEKFPDGFFVMQPIGDTLHGTDKICGSPWFGRKWLERAYQGRGPFWPGYFQFYGDEELKKLTERKGVLWQRGDLAQHHEHYLRTGIKTEYQHKNEVRYWDIDKMLFASREMKGFPGHSPKVEWPDKDARIVVTGAGGFIGHHLVNRLVAEGCTNITAIDIKEPEFSTDRARWGEYDFDLRTSLEHAWDSMRDMCHNAYVFHLAADMGGIGFIETYKGAIVANNTRIDLNVLDAAHFAKAKRLLFSSSACVYPAGLQQSADVVPLAEHHAYPAQAEDGYGWQKLYTEMLCRHYREDFGLDTRIARYHNIYGPEGTYEGGREKAPAALCRKTALVEAGGQLEIWGDGHQTRSYCYVDDCVEATIRLMLSDYVDPINIGTDELVSVREMAGFLQKLSGKEYSFRYDTTKPQGVRGRNADLSLVNQTLNWSPVWPFDEGLKKTYEWIRSRLAK